MESGKRRSSALTVELAVRGDLSSNLESNGDKGLANGVVEHRLAVGTVLVEGCRTNGQYINRYNTK